MSAPKIRQITATTGYVPLPDIQCNHVSILNNTGQTLDIQMVSDAADASYSNTLAGGQSWASPVVANAKEVQIKSASGTTGVQVTLNFYN